MRTRTALLAIFLATGALCSVGAPTAAQAGGDPREEIAREAVFGDDGARLTAIVHLRRAGPQGLRILGEIHHDFMPLLRAGAVQGNVAATGPRPIVIERLRTALDSVAQQRGAHNSLLYWFTDLEAAKAEAKRSQRPILSLRMLGKLTDEQSCANSRYFRTVLYANQEVADQLRKSFVLHWSSERPVPVVTVDFGDGRVLKRTMMGNSAHYVLDFQGRPVDVLPGLYGPQAFLKGVGDAAAMAREVQWLSHDDANSRLAALHYIRLRGVKRNWTADLAKSGGPDLWVRYPSGDDDSLPMLAKLDAATSEPVWKRIAALHADDARLAETSRALVRNEKRAGPPAADAMRVAVGKAAAEMPMLKVVQGAVEFEQNVALDTIRNEYRLHSVIHKWFARRESTANFAQLNERVYAELFLTPATDPWMGLAPTAYTGLEDAGMSVSAP